MSENKTITALHNGRNKQTVCLRQTDTLLTANHRFAYGKLLRTLLLVMITLGAHGAWGQPVEITRDVNGNGTIDDNEKKFYLIQTNAFPSFYIAPQANNTITTNNILGEYMLWYFLDAGNDGTQYYYIVNNSTGKYVSHADGSANNDTKRAVPLVVKDQSNDESCKFKLVLNKSEGADFYNIIVKGSQTYYALNKRGGSMVNTKPIQLTNKDYINNIHSLWKFIPFNGTFTYPTPPFTPSNASETHYYEIHNVQKDTYYAATDATPDKVIFTDQANESRAWYFIEAASDTWYKYYYIINPSTGYKYMYYDGTADNTSNQTNAISVKAYDSNDEDRYQFVVVQAARGDGASRVTCYAIIPKLLIDNLWTSSSIGYAQASITNGANMGIINSRGENNGAHWKFDATEYTAVCATPVFVYDDVQQRFSITCATPEAKIYYKGYNEGEEVPTFTFPGDLGTLYTGPFDKGAYEYYVAVAARCIDDGSDQSAPGYGNTESLKYKYHLIDKSHREVIAVGSNEETLGLPVAYQSPLVTHYHYYTAANITNNIPNGSEMTSLSDLGEGEKDIYVTYDVSPLVRLDGTQYYMLRYQNPNNTQLYEEAGDRPKGFPENTQNMVYYPYTNGKEGFNLYGDQKKDAAFDDGESTRTRFLWYFEGGDPYRVKIHSYNGTGTSYHALPGPYPSYFHTFYGNGGSTTTGHTGAAVHTVLTQTDRTNHEPTEYMILNGTGSNTTSFPYRLMTTAASGPNGTHLVVSSIDHQWLNAAHEDSKYSSRTTNWYQMPELGNDFTQYNKNRQDETTHAVNLWYETVDLGTDFQIEPLQLLPVLHLVDNHGWEIAHWSMENTEACRNRIKQFNSPMVKEYRWYSGEAQTGSNRAITKETGYYKYYINTAQPVATTADLTSNWMHVNFDDVSQNLNFYVFYDAKDEYGNNNSYLLDLGGKMAEVSGSTINYTANGTDYHTGTELKNGVTPTAAMQWLVAANPNLDTENAYTGTTGSPEPGKDANRFDPYSLRIESAATTSNYYTVNGTSYTISLTAGTATQFTYTDRADLTRQNRGTTFMAVQGTDGKMRLVLRNSDRAESLNRALDSGGTATETAATTTENQTAVLVPTHRNVYTIVRSDGTQVISSTSYTKTLRVPADIVSPLLDDTYYSFYPTLQDAAAKTNALTNETFATRYTDPVYVRYDENTYGNTPIDLSGETWYNMRNGNQFMICEGGQPAFTTTTPTDEQLNDNKFFWKFSGDPYTVTVSSKTTTDAVFANTFIWLGNSTYGWNLLANTPALNNQYAYLYNDGQGHAQQHREALGQTTTGDNLFVEQYDLKSYTYHIINTTGTEAVKYTTQQRSVTPLNYDNLPAAIRSPYIEDETLTFYSDAACTTAITTAGEATDIYVKYSTNQLGNKRLDLKGTSEYKMRVGGTYVYDNAGTLATGTPTDNWVLTGSDPYAVEIKSKTGEHSISYDTSSPSLSLGGTDKAFILLGGKSGTLVELMAATGVDIASETYYSIGLDAGTFSLYSSADKSHLDDALQVNFSKVVNESLMEIAFSSDMTANPAGRYKALPGFTVDETISTFTGEFDGDFQEISSTSQPLFNTATGAIIKNVIIGSVSISGGTDAGAIANVADGETRIYNCGVLGGSVSGSGKVGGLVGTLNGSSRVINCFSYANVSGGTYAAGIVGYNSHASTTADLKTMVMNCMFYGNVESGTNISPVYGGAIIDNSGATGLNNFNYFLADNFTDFITRVTDYNCALGAEERFLTRFEFYRQILNSNLPLASWYARGTSDNYANEMAKWVLETADRNIAEPKPYPVLHKHGKYPSIINIDAAHAGMAADPEGTYRNKGYRLGTLNVSIGLGTGAPLAARLTTTVKYLNITDKDFDRYNFNYYKVQLPYYNEVGVGNYTDNKVVTGWKITSIEGGTPGTFKAEDSSEGYNFADRDCTKKDLYSVTGRVFSQGAYFDVPNGVTGITIEPVWAKAVYLADPCYDKTYTKDFSNNNGNASDITAMGTRYTDDDNYLINGSSQKVYTTMGNAITALDRPSGSSVYEYAVVLVGNYHHYYGSSPITNDKNGFTIMSADLDFDNEPDNCFIYQHTNRQPVSPIRFDFLCLSGIGMAQKPSNSTRMPGIGIFKPRGWFEVTNTCLAQFYQFEYDWGTKDADQGGSPLILLGGIYEQIVSSNDGAPTHTKYIHLGSNAWFKMFNNGIHADKDDFTPHKPISVTGGDYDLFYLSGMFKPSATVNADNAECYITGGRFGEVAGAGQEQINGDVYWQIDRADITDFYGGGINDAKPVKGNITIDITNSNVTTYCGGPKFGDMSSDKVVTTTAENCTFGKYFGAGYGGTSLNKVRKRNYTNSVNYKFNEWATHANHGYKRQYETTTSLGGNVNGDPNSTVTVNAISTNYEYELFAYSGFADNNNVGRFYVNYASLSLATTRNVTSTLTGCKITGNFYGGGSLGKVDGDVNSTLKDCTVHGNVFGAGFSATAPTVKVFPKEGFATEPSYDGKSGTYTQGVYPTPVTYTWHQVSSVSTGKEFDETNKLIYTTVDMSTLGTVVGDVTLNIEGTTSVGGSVYGGGEESAVSGDVAVNMTAGTVAKNVFGGGKGMADSFQCEKAMVGVNGDGVDHPAGGTTVTITGGTVNGSVYGGGEVGRVEKNTVVNIGTGDGTATAEASPVINGSVYGAGKGVSTHGYAALVRGNATVNVTGNAAVMQSVYGGGEIASVGRYTVAQTEEEATAHDVEIGEPYSLANSASGNCTVTVGGYAEIGPDDMRMKKAEGDPDDTGYVFGAGKGVLPYEGYAAEETPWRQTPGADMASNDDDGKENYGAVNEENYIKYIGTLALTTQTFVTIKDHAFIKGSVYGGSENGHVQHDTDVKIQDHCQIGNGWNGTSGVNERYDEADFINPATATAAEIEAKAAILHECASWDYGAEEGGKMVYHPYDKYDARDGASKIGTDGHTFFGNVFGGGSGLYPYLSRKEGVGYEWIRTAGQVSGNTTVTITGGHILTSVYGGCELTDVADSVTLKEGKGKCTIKMSGGTLGVPRTLEQISAHPVTCYLFGAGKGDQRVRFNQWTNVGSVEVEISGGIIYGSVFGGGEDGHVLGDVRLTVKANDDPSKNPVIGTWGTSYVDGNIFGGGRGFGGDALTAGVVSGNVTIDIQGGTMLGSIYGGGRLGSVGTYLVPKSHENYGKLIPDATGITHGNITINISGGTIGNNLEYLYNPGDAAKAKIPNTTFDHQNHVLYTKGGNVFTGGMGRLYELDGTTLLPHWSNMAKARNTELNISGGTIKSNVYGGAELGTVEGNATVNIKGGTIGTKVVNPKDATQYYYYGSVFGGGKGSTEAIADKYPAGTDEALKTDISKAGQVGGNVAVNLNNGVSNTAKGGIVHKIFGCNDTNGSPLGAVTVHVYKTQNEAATTIVNPAEGAQNAKVRGRYDVEAVYGGGNLASYQPTDGTKVAKVIIDGCDETSIETVYGGGNAASTPGTHVEVNASYEIGTIFGGGNGKDLLPSGGENPGAHVGYKADGTTSYGTGCADVQLKGGTIHSAFGGSNTKGNVRVKATVDLSEPDKPDCPLVIEEVYGAGNEAEQDGTAEIILGCLSYLKEIYGGAKNANIDSDVTLTIRSGRFDRVFGGNNLGGKISGTITVNIEETGCHPIIIGQLYGGGNRAAYSVDDIATGRSDLDYEDASAANYYRNFPKVNVRSFTSIGEIYGGGYGAEAEVTGNPFVDINVCEGGNRSNEVENRTIDGATVSVSKNTGKTITLNAGQADERSLEIPLHKSGAIGAIGSVYGGGNAANVIGDTHVSIGTKMTEDIVFETPKTKKVTVEGVTSEVSTTAAERTHEVKGADIRGNVFGGGNRANVTGNTDVKVGR